MRRRILFLLALETEGRYIDIVFDANDESPYEAGYKALKQKMGDIPFDVVYWDWMEGTQSDTSIAIPPVVPIKYFTQANKNLE